MIIWGIFFGALVGSYAFDYYGMGVYLGAAGGLIAGMALRYAVRKEIAASNAKLRQEMEAWFKLQGGRVAEGAADTVAKTTADMASSVITDVAGPGASAISIQAPASSQANVDPFDLMALPEAAPLTRATAVGQATASSTIVSPLPDSTAPAADTTPVHFEPTAADRAFAAAKNWLLGGNTIVRVGLVILFIGLSFLASYAASAGLFPVEFRLAIVAAAGIALLVVGFRKRLVKPAFALALQGGGVAVIYLTLFAAFRLFGLIPPMAAFTLMIVVCALSCALALMQDARSLAVAAFAGGFATPLLLSTGEGSSVALFGYYTVLNLAILYIAHKRAWRILNMVGFVATFGVATLWGVLKYTPEAYVSSQFFLAVFVVIYLAAAVMYARNTPTRLGNAVDSTLIFGTALAGFGLQTGLVQQFEFGMAFSALGFAALYMALAAVLTRRTSGNYRLMIECLLVVGIGFLTLAVPLALDAHWTSGVWSLEGAAAFWVGTRQQRWMPRAFGLLLQPIAALTFVASLGSNAYPWPLLNPLFIGAMLIALPAFLIAWWLRSPLPHSNSAWARLYVLVESRLCAPVFLYGFLFWCCAFGLEFARALPAVDSDAMSLPVFDTATQEMLTLLAVVGSAWLSAIWGRRHHWEVATWPSRFSLVALGFGFLLQELIEARVLYTPAWIIWPVVLVLHYRMLYQNDQSGVSKLARATHAGSVWLVTLLLGDCIWFWIGRGELWQTSWAAVVVLISAIIVLLLLALWGGKANRPAQVAAARWPRNPHAVAYYWYAAVPLAVLVFAGALLVALFASGHAEPLPYIPFLNPIDLSLALALTGLELWRRAVTSADPQPPGASWVRHDLTVWALAALAFVAINTVWLRIAHHFFGVEWDSVALFDSFVVQTGYAILWTVLALAAMVLAHRRRQRALWLTGAGLLGLVVVKLLLIDLSNAGGAERIVTFIVVGILMLVVGYFAPLPPKTNNDMPGEPAT